MYKLKKNGTMIVYLTNGKSYSRTISRDLIFTKNWLIKKDGCTCCDEKMLIFNHKDKDISYFGISENDVENICYENSTLGYVSKAEYDFCSAFFYNMKFAIGEKIDRDRKTT